MAQDMDEVAMISHEKNQSSKYPARESVGVTHSTDFYSILIAGWKDILEASHSNNVWWMETGGDDWTELRKSCSFKL